MSRRKREARIRAARKAQKASRRRVTPEKKIWLAAGLVMLAAPVVAFLLRHPGYMFITWLVVPFVTHAVCLVVSRVRKGEAWWLGLGDFFKGWKPSKEPLWRSEISSSTRRPTRGRTTEGGGRFGGGGASDSW